MFGRRRHAAPVSASKLTEKQLFDLVHARLASELGANGAWVLSRRTPSSGDEIFHEVYAQQLAHDIATDIDLEQAAVTVRAEAAPARGWRLWSRGQEESAVDAAGEVEAVEAIEPTVAEEPAAITETIDAPSEAAADDTEPTLVERTLLEPQHYPITVWAEPEFIDASLVNPVPARRSSVA
ncbi:hypothetical protein [Plantibacter cousiniae (nom. nud.)]|uniref:Uncharacterized protein n=1 Tax=Plantibacter cousiniae (nom. nud.) TaxID=199709 RepID=A0ABY1LLC6_9MICO|nr:hypothetical protein [Plantibacter cousiniae]SKC54208.1 hypothetical protein SAMN06295973_1820 [Plantibacter cousiniae]